MTSAKQLTFPQKTQYNTHFQRKKKNKIIEVNLCDKYQKTVPIAKRYFLMNETTLRKHTKEILLNQLTFEAIGLLLVIEFTLFH